MSQSVHAPIRPTCRKKIAALQLSRAERAQLEKRVVERVQANIESGRFERVAAQRAKLHPLTLAQYVDSVIYWVRREQARIDALENGDPAAWNWLYEFLCQNGRRLIWKFRNGAEVETAARDFANQVCLTLWKTRYPFDVSLEAWALKILWNDILRHYTRSPDVMNQRIAPKSLDDPITTDDGAITFLGELIADPQSLAPFEKTEIQNLLLNALERLPSPEQRYVIIAGFLRGRDSAQIAKELGKRKQAIYNLRQRALARLKEILLEMQSERK